MAVGRRRRRPDGLRLGRRTSSSPRRRSPARLPSADALKAATDVVLLTPRGAAPSEVEADQRRSCVSASTRRWSSRRRPRRTSRCCWPTATTSSRWSGSGSTRASRTSSTGGRPAWPAPSPPGSRSAPGWSTPPRCRRCTPAGPRPGRSSPCCWRGSSRSAPPVAVTPAGQELLDAIGDQLGARLAVTALRRHVIAVVAALFALAVGHRHRRRAAQLRARQDDAASAATRARTTLATSPGRASADRRRRRLRRRVRRGRRARALRRPAARPPDRDRGHARSGPGRRRGDGRPGRGRGRRPHRCLRARRQASPTATRPRWSTRSAAS